jgi:hypothetical protein
VITARESSHKGVSLQRFNCFVLSSRFSDNLNLNPWFKRGAWHKLLIPQRIKKCPLNLRVKLRFFETPVKPVSCTMHPRLNHGFGLNAANVDHTESIKMQLWVNKSFTGFNENCVQQTIS